MIISFTKYHGNGNDFIIIDQRKSDWDPLTEEVASLCDRHYGIGADGLILLSAGEGFDFAMKYYNSDGLESSMCGNGGRCITAEAARLGLFTHRARFHAIDGPHEAIILDQHENLTLVRLKMTDSSLNATFDDGLFIDTGSPHFVKFVGNTADVNVFAEGRALRYENRFAPGGTNVDFVQIHPDFLEIRSYERGVEDETLSCGTGATASALAAAILDPGHAACYRVKTRGGELKVSFLQKGTTFREIWLEGPARMVFSGEIRIKEK